LCNLNIQEEKRCEVIPDIFDCIQSGLKLSGDLGERIPYLDGLSAEKAIEEVKKMWDQKELKALCFQEYAHAMAAIADAFRGKIDPNSVIAVRNCTDQKFDAIIILEGTGEASEPHTFITSNIGELFGLPQHFTIEARKEGSDDEGVAEVMYIYTRKNPIATVEAASKCTHITCNMCSNIYSSITLFVLRTLDADDSWAT
jgi:hypothetical protein